MNYSTASIEKSDSDLVAHLLVQRARILTRIIDNKNVSSTKTTKNPTTRYLQQEYNHVTDQIAQLEHQPLSDPMNALPLELCADIIKEAALPRDDPVDRLLDLTTVSRRWCNIITSLPTLWTTIVFDPTKDDYLAKAAVGLSLSGTCELSVTIAVPFELWREVSPIILTESGRIVYLRIDDPVLDVSDSEKILHDFEGLPVLKNLCLPTEYHSGDFDSRSRDVDFEKMPLLCEITGPRPEPLDYSCSRFVKSRTLFLAAITQNMVDIWATLSNLIHLDLYENGVLPDYSPKVFESSLPSIKRFYYFGKALERALSLLGPNVTSMAVLVYNFRQVLDLLGRFPQIYDLRLMVSNTFDYEGADIEPIPTSSQSIERLEIRGHLYYGMNITEIKQAIPSWRALYQALAGILPCVKTLILEDALFFDETWSYISGLNQLQEITVSYCRFYLSKPRSFINMEYLSYISWSMPPDSAVIFSKIIAPSLRSLQMNIAPEEWTPVDADATNYSISENAFPSLASLTIAFAMPASWNIGIRSYDNLRELILQHSYASDFMIGADILETILMRPRDFPVLEKIELAHLLFEYDILLLMLERKNIYAQPGISPITTVVVNGPLSYRLLYPIATLLRGKFPAREPNVAFSLEAVGQRTFDELSTGCERCCFNFRPCLAPIQSGRNTYEYRLQDDDLNPKDMAKDVVADPPLTLDMKEWLAGKTERRQSFLRRHRETQDHFHRARRCPEVGYDYSSFIVTGSSLDEFELNASEPRGLSVKMSGIKSAIAAPVDSSMGFVASSERFSIRGFMSLARRKSLSSDPPLPSSTASCSIWKTRSLMKFPEFIVCHELYIGTGGVYLNLRLRLSSLNTQTLKPQHTDITMNHYLASIKYRDSDQIVNLLAQRTKILTRLINNKNILCTKTTNNPTTRYLQREYNHMTERIVQLEYQPLSDPMKVLPLELCADIIEEAVAYYSPYSPVDNLLDLTTVSRLWCRILMSLPTLWTSIVFDSTKRDYLATAATGLFLSGGCDLRVTIAVPFKLWPEVSPIILAESGRIVCLQIINPPLDRGDSEKILHNFGGLPVLRTLLLPTEHNSSNFDSRPRNIEFEKMPLLSDILGTCPEPLEYSCSRFIQRRTISIPAITQDMVNVWAKFSNLVDLYVNEYGVWPGYSPKTFELSLPSIREFCHDPVLVADEGRRCLLRLAERSNETF
ncbi:hypothetical protein M408DRAFT_27813 [Serendipita vermifera MAFF 305830]|uniref:Uncharacterized protein n=1 Tax=Serendipita vermifera MAFF 305830 TaxID=933852 RepID=A0A0C3AVZ4_SERVB|nr:hypothetical protein M408DRAFT_27813 [Serendipita vermifera MAFF 305830]